MLAINFRLVRLGETFLYNGTQYRKTTSRTARTLRENRCFYFGKLDDVYVQGVIKRYYGFEKGLSS